MQRRVAFILSIFTFLLIMFSASADEIIPPAREIPEYVQQLLDIAIAEIGYAENNKYTKYGEWNGDPFAEWCAEFLCWCVDQTDIQHGLTLLNEQYPKYSSSNVGRNWFIKKGRYIDRSGYIEGWGYQWFQGEDSFIKKDTYIPQAGDWVFFTWTGGTDTDHVAMVEYCSTDDSGNVNIHVIEGNNPDTVARNIYPINSWKILGYGTVHKMAETTIVYGNEGDDVLHVQQQLNELGLLTERNMTGLFGSNSRAAIKTFQRGLKALNESGIVNIQTRRELDAAIERHRDENSENFLVED